MGISLYSQCSSSTDEVTLCLDMGCKYIVFVVTA
jgi:hypothetical protein